MTEPTSLSNRETEVLQLVAEGLTNREISQRLSISANTVKVHLRNIFEKTGVASRTEATVYAIEQRIVAVPGGENVQPDSKNKVWGFNLNHPFMGLASILFIITLITLLFINLFNSTQKEGVAFETVNRWQKLTPMPEERAGLAAVAYNNQIYAIGGEGKEGVSGSVFRFDIEEDSWERLLDKPTPVTDIGGVLIGEKIYIPGGLDSDGDPVDVLDIYDPRHDAWSAGASLPEPLSAYAIAGFEGKLYLFGGWNGRIIENTVWVYDPETNIWLNSGSFDFGFRDSVAVALSDSIVLLGGQNDSGVVLDTISFYPSRLINDEESWKVFGTLPIESGNISAVALNGLIYLFSIDEVSEVEGRQDYDFFFYSDSSWQSLNIEMDLGEYQNSAIVSIGSQLFFLVMNSKSISTDMISYQALYYEIYVPIIK